MCAALSLYGHFKSARTSLFDVTVGGNGACDTVSPAWCTRFFGGNPNVWAGGMIDCAFPATGASVLANRYQCYARAGYDGPSGVGTPKGVTPFKPLKPTAKITKPASVTHGVAASFSGAASTDPFPGGSISSYKWTWGDGSTSTVTTNPVTHTWTSAGSYPVKLTVTDSYGQVSTVASSTVTVG